MKSMVAVERLRLMLDASLDFVLPQFCVVCEQEGDALCDDCIHRIDICGVFLCPVCHESSEGGRSHEVCDSYLDGVVSVVHYGNVEVQEMVRLCKYVYLENYGVKMGEMMHQFLQHTDLIDGVICVPVPLASRRYAERGFNQSEVLAREIGEVFDCLRRVRDTRRQVDMIGVERLSNVYDAFRCIQKPPFGRGVVLIDDVATSCATLQECARILKDVGVEKVWGFTFARG